MTFFELSGGSGQRCNVCGPWEGVIVSDDAAQALEAGVPLTGDVEGAGAFHSKCHHTWTEVSAGEQKERSRPLNDEEKFWVSRYQMSSYSVNEGLRHPATLSASQKEGVSMLDAAFTHSPNKLDQATTLYRGIDKKEYGILERAAIQGKAYKVKSYVSTTSDRQIAVDFADTEFNPMSGGKILEIRVPAGTRTLNVDEIAQQSGASEVLLERGRTYSLHFAQNKVDIVMEMMP